MEQKEQNWKERLQHTYRLVIMNDETFEEMGSYKLTLLNFYILLSSIVVVVATVVILLIAFTPLKRYLPGYTPSDNYEEVVELSNQVRTLEKQLIAYDEYFQNIEKIIDEDVEREEDIPQEEVVTVDTSENVERIEEDEELRQQEQLKAIGLAAQQLTRTTSFNQEKPLEQMYFTPPLKGEISAHWSKDEQHYGIDILAPKNTAIKAAMDGFVFMSDWTMETGNTIGIQHTNNIITFYKHNSALLKDVGSYVKAGEAVAIIGNTGTLTDGPHLHFELWHKGKSVDPNQYIDFQ